MATQTVSTAPLRGPSSAGTLTLLARLTSSAMSATSRSLRALCGVRDGVCLMHQRHTDSRTQRENSSLMPFSIPRPRLPLPRHSTRSVWSTSNSRAPPLLSNPELVSPFGKLSSSSTHHIRLRGNLQARSEGEDSHPHPLPYGRCADSRRDWYVTPGSPAHSLLTSARRC